MCSFSCSYCIVLDSHASSIRLLIVHRTTVADVLSSMYVYVNVNRAGRKVLLICGALGMSLFLSLMAILTTLDYRHQHRSAPF
jgi:hypothetical protein